MVKKFWMKLMPTSKVVSHPQVSIGSDARVFLAGKTGSGKTTAAKMLLMDIGRLLVVDSKDGLHDWATRPWTSETRIALAGGEPVRIRIVDDDQALDALQVAYDAGNVVVYIDEVTAFIPPRKDPPQVVINIWQRGRSRNVGGWAGSQRPTWVPLLFLSEAEHFFIFRLNVLEDRKRFAEFAGNDVLEAPPAKYGFWYFNNEDDLLIGYKKVVA